MIDDYAQAMELVERMKAHLPISARPTKALVRVMRDKGVKLPTRKEVIIEKVFYAGDEGGIVCGLHTPINQGEVFVASLTHLRVKGSHPLYEEICAYQVARTKTLNIRNRNQ